MLADSIKKYDEISKRLSFHSGSVEFPIYDTEKDLEFEPEVGQVILVVGASCFQHSTYGDQLKHAIVVDWKAFPQDKILKNKNKELLKNFEEDAINIEIRQRSIKKEDHQAMTMKKMMKKLRKMKKDQRTAEVLVMNPDVEKVEIKAKISNVNLSKCTDFDKNDEEYWAIRVLIRKSAEYFESVLFGDVAEKAVGCTVQEWKDKSNTAKQELWNSLKQKTFKIWIQNTVYKKKRIDKKIVDVEELTENNEE